MKLSTVTLERSCSARDKLSIVIDLPGSRIQVFKIPSNFETMYEKSSSKFNLI
jgi:hypothetical protein